MAQNRGMEDVNNHFQKCSMKVTFRKRNLKKTFILGGFGQTLKPLESKDDSAEISGLLERLTTTLDFLLCPRWNQLDFWV